VEQFWHPEIDRTLKSIDARLARIGAQNDQIIAQNTRILRWLTRSPARMSLAIEGVPMPLTVDSVNAVAVLAFEDDHGDAVSAPSGALATATSSDTDVLTVGAAVPGTDANGNATITFPLTEVAMGTSSLSVVATDANGNPLLGPDGVTPIPAPAAVEVTVNPGAPAEEVFTVPGD
jgi:hypothetical protein